MSVRAKVYCSSKTELPDGSGAGTVTFNTVTSGSEENEKFFHLTPGGSIYLSILNPETMKQFEQGKEYFVDFTPAE